MEQREALEHLIRLQFHDVKKLVGEDSRPLGGLNAEQLQERL